MTDAPASIRALQAERVLELTWPDGRADRLGYAYLRGECPCAACRHEWTGERLLDPKDIPPDIRLEGLEGIGNYAVRLQWSDGHGSGIYTWETLANLAAGAP